MALETHSEFRNPAYAAPRAQPLSQADLARDLSTYFRNYARERPDVVALWCFGVGFVLGWKLKPW